MIIAKKTIEGDLIGLTYIQYIHKYRATSMEKAIGNVNNNYHDLSIV